jgi:hypothetical protein
MTLKDPYAVRQVAQGLGDCSIEGAVAVRQHTLGQACDSCIQCGQTCMHLCQSLSSDSFGLRLDRPPRPWLHFICDPCSMVMVQGKRRRQRVGVEKQGGASSKSQMPGVYG